MPLKKQIRFEQMEPRTLFSKAPLFAVHNFVSDNTTTIPAAHQDANLVNGWGIADGPGTEQWVANNLSGTSTLYDGSGNVDPLVVTIPGAGGGQSLPTGEVFNGGSSFQVSSGVAAQFLFASEDGTISAWSPAQADQSKAVIKVDNSASGATYRGLATDTFNAQNFLLATNDSTDKIDVFDSNFQPAHLNGSFRDKKIPASYEPFGIQNINGLIYVTYALKSIYEGNTPEGSGYIDVFLPDGSLDHRLVKRGTLNSPWGVARVPGGFGKFKRDIAVGNFGDGRIQVFDPKTGEFRGFFRKASNNKPVKIDGLWGLDFGNDGLAGASNELFFTAGPNAEADGLFGKLTLVPTTTPSSTNPGGNNNGGYIFPMSAASSSQASLFSNTSVDKTCDHSVVASDPTSV